MFEIPPILQAMAVGVPALIAIQLFGLHLIDLNARKARISRSLGRMPTPSGSKQTSIFGRIAQYFRYHATLTLERLSVMRGGDAETSAMLLRSAGFRSRDAVLIHAFFKLVLPPTSFLLIILWFIVARAEPTNWPVTIIWACAVALGLSILPDMVLKHLRDKRFKQIRRSFPDMLELLVIASESGLSANPSLNRVSAEIQAFCPPLAFELQHLVIELSILPNRETAWRNFSTRLPMAEMAIFSNTLIQAERFGTPFAGAMRTLMHDERASRLLKIEEQAGRAPALMTIPLILFIMPPLFIVLVGPAALSILDNIMNGGGG